MGLYDVTMHRHSLQQQQQQQQQGCGCDDVSWQGVAVEASQEAWEVASSSCDCEGALAAAAAALQAAS
jgi:hypothetical protein